MTKKKKRNKKLYLLLIFLLALTTIVTSIIIQKTVVYLGSRAETIEDNMLPSMKQSTLEFNIPKEIIPTESDQDPETGVTYTPAPIPTGVKPTDKPSGGGGSNTGSGQLCMMDQVKSDPSCKCTDLEGFKCGDKTDGANNFHYKVDVRKSDTEGVYVAPKGMYLFRTSFADYAAMKNNPKCIEWCIGKPVIYLYPEVPTLVNVDLEIPGEVFISDPHYPTGGWKNVLANPDGSLKYQGNTYHELYYETKLNTDVKAPTTGILIPTEQLAEKLSEITKKLGLKENEREEFLGYWLPELEALHAPFIQFSIIDESEKERIDHVNISPQPDTFIAFIAYFKPMWEFKPPAELALPDNPPQRKGFTAVEWGGTIERGSK